MKIGVVALQGDVSEHLEAIEKILGKDSSVAVRNRKDLETISGLIIPGGESTTISELMQKAEIFDEVRKLGEQGFPIYGTCAGLILLAKQGDEQVKKTSQKLLGLMDTRINRNAFGRQRESFEIVLDIGSVKKFTCVFIRAPAIVETFGKCKTLAKFENYIVAAKQDNLFATAFHPELTDDLRIHRYFIEEIV